MRTARSLTDRISWYQAGGACVPHMPPQPYMPPRPCMPPGHACPPAMHAPQPCMPPSHAPPLWTEFLTHASENITLPQTSFAGGKNTFPFKNRKFRPRVLCLISREEKKLLCFCSIRDNSLHRNYLWWRSSLPVFLIWKSMHKTRWGLEGKMGLTADLGCLQNPSRTKIPFPNTHSDWSHNDSKFPSIQ